ncbi:MAG: hypothetical protein ABR583_12480 [Gaiellaceae bacterium]
MVRRFAALPLLALALAACSGNEDEKPEARSTTASPQSTLAARPPTGPEREWAELVGQWALQFGGDLNAVSVNNCVESLDVEVGPAPTGRVADLEGLALDVCRAYRRLAGARGAEREAAQDTAHAAEQQLNERLFSFEFTAGPNRPLPVKGGLTGESRIEPRLTRALQELVGEGAEARCWSDGDWQVVATHNPYGAGEVGGFVESGGKIQLAPAVCKPLVAYLYGDRDDDDDDLVWSLVVFAHEARHAAGEDEEDKAECYAMQDARRLGRLIGLAGKTADTIAERYWRERYPLNEFPYRSEECRDGGALDLHPDSRIWP